jgi:hypothetical protein
MADDSDWFLRAILKSGVIAFLGYFFEMATSLV